MSEQKLELDFDDLFENETKLLMDSSNSEPLKREKRNQEENQEENSLKEESPGKTVELIIGKNASGEPYSSEFEEEEAEPSKKDEGKTEKAPSSNETDESEKDASGSFALAFAKFQVDEGVISDFDEKELLRIEQEEGMQEALKYLLGKQKETIAEEVKKVYAADKEEVEQYFRLKDAGIDPETAQKLVYNQKMYDSITDEELEANDKLREEILFNHYKATTTFSDAKIEKLIKNAFSSGEDVDEAKEALETLRDITKKEIKEAEKRAEEEEKAYREQVKKNQEEFKKMVMDKEEFFEGIKVNKQTKDKVIDMVLKPVAKDQNGNLLNGIWSERAKDPQKFDAYLAYHILTGTFWGKIDAVKKKVKTDTVSELETLWKGKGGSLGGKPVKPSMTSEKDALEQFMKI